MSPEIPPISAVHKSAPEEHNFIKYFVCVALVRCEKLSWNQKRCVQNNAEDFTNFRAEVLVNWAAILHCAAVANVFIFCVRLFDAA